MNDYPQIRTTIMENVIPVTTVIDAPWVSVTSLNGMTGDVIVEPIVRGFTPNFPYVKDNLISVDGVLYTAKANFTSGSTFDTNDWNQVGGATAIPIASANTLGGIKVGNNLTITNDGILSATGGELPHDLAYIDDDTPGDPIKIKTDDIEDRAITSAKIQDNAITSSKLEDESVSSSKIDKLGLLELVYPVGSLYMSFNNVSPSSFLGGTWVRIEDRFLLAAGSTYTAGDTGGSATHSHNLSVNGYAKIILKAASKILYRENTVPGWTANYQNSTGSGSGASSTESYGAELGGKTDNTTTLPPYLVVYMWRRTA